MVRQILLFLVSFPRCSSLVFTFHSIKTTASSPLFGLCLLSRVLHLLIVPSPLYTAASAPRFFPPAPLLRSGSSSGTLPDRSAFVA